jgi:hypothetical protein
VLLVPCPVRRRRGSIVAIAGAPDEADIEVASAIAAAAREELVVIEAYQRAEPSRRGPIGEPKTPTRRIPAGCGALTDAQHLATLLANGNESLIVITREATAAAADNIGIAIAEARRVPVLILEPPPRRTAF